MALNKKLRLFFAAVLISLGIISAGYFVYIYTFPFSEEKQLISVIPGDAIVVLHLTDPFGFWKELSSTTYWEDLKQIQAIRQIDFNLSKLDSIVTGNSKFLELITLKDSYLSLHQEDGGKVGLLYLIRVNSRLQRNLMRTVIRLATDGTETLDVKNHGKKVYRIPGNGSTDSFFFAFVRKTALMSSDSSLIIRAVEQSEEQKNLLNNDPSFGVLLESAGKKVPAHLYINNAKVGKALPGILTSQTKEKMGAFILPGGWSVLDVTIKEKELLINGFTASGDPESPFAKMIGNQSPQPITIQKILPYNTSFAVITGIEDFEAYLEIIQERRPVNVTASDSMPGIQPGENPIGLRKRMTSIAGTEICLAYVQASGSPPGQNAYLIIRQQDSLSSRISLDVLTDNSASVMFDGTAVQKLSMSNPFKILFDPVPDNNELRYYANLDGYLVFGSSASAVQRFLSYYKAGRTLGNDGSTRDFFDNFSETSNLSFFINFRYAGSLIEQAFEEGPLKIFTGESGNLDHFDGIALQFSQMEDLTYTSLHLNHDPGHVRELPYIWKTNLDATIRNGPYLISSDIDGKKNIMVCDSLNQMYLLDENGQVRWKCQVSGPVISPVNEVHYYKDKRTHYLFNTADQIILLDGQGNPVGDYPITLGYRASNGLLVIDYENNKDYRIILCSEDLRIYNYDIKGNPVKGWTSPDLGSPVRVPAQHLVAGNKDYLIFASENGHVLMTDRKGQTRIRIEQAFVNSTRTSFYLNRSGGTGIMLTTDVYGNLISVPSSGQVKKTGLGDFLPDHYFLYFDFNNDRSPDYIFLDQNQLSVFNRDRHLIFEYDFQDVIDHELLSFSIPAKGNYLGLLAKTGGKIFLLNQNGLVPWCTDLTGDTPFVIGKVRPADMINLVTGFGNAVITYRIE
jgi:hypothetical protein